MIFDPFNVDRGEREFKGYDHSKDFDFSTSADPIRETRDEANRRIRSEFDDEFGRYLDEYWGTEREPGQPEEKAKTGWTGILF